MGAFKLGLIGLLLGVVAGAWVGGTREKERLVAEYEAAATDSLAAHGESQEETEAEGDHGVASDPAHGDTTTDPVDGDADAAADDPEVGPGHGAEDAAAPAEEEPSPTSGAETSGGMVMDAAEDAGPEGLGGASAATAAAGVAAPVQGTALEEGARKLAKIFGAMKPADAADVLKEMEDAEVQAILEYMSDRKAAQILGAFPPERAARLSQVVLAAGGSGR